MTKSAVEICKLVFGLNDEEATYMVNDLAMEIMMTDVNFYERFSMYRPVMSVSDAMKKIIMEDSQ
jgi:hypothetical protein